MSFQEAFAEIEQARRECRPSYLSCAYLQGAYLQGAYLQGAYLRSANLNRANLHGADLYGANLYGADLYGADLRGANLNRANLYGANLQRADLRRANLSGANLSGTNLQDANLPFFQICPSEGSFIAWKSVDGAILKLEIPQDAVRTSSLVGRKCRATHVKVLAAYGLQKEAYYTRNDCVYEVGKTTWADAWDDDIRVECTSGIHFFMTLEEAEDCL